MHMECTMTVNVVSVYIYCALCEYTIRVIDFGGTSFHGLEMKTSVFMTYIIILTWPVYKIY